MLKIYIQPEDVWEHFQTNRAHLMENLDVVAEIIEGRRDNEVVGLQVFVTEQNDLPILSVEYEDEVLAREYAISKNDCTSVAKKYIKMIEDFSDLSEDNTEGNDYSDEEIIGFSEDNHEPDGDSEHSLEEDREYVEEREEELKMALYNFILESVGCTEEELVYDDSSIKEILDELEDTMYTVAGYTMFRPVIVEPADANGRPKIVESRFDA